MYPLNSFPHILIYENDERDTFWGIPPDNSTGFCSLGTLGAVMSPGDPEPFIGLWEDSDRLLTIKEVHEHSEALKLPYTYTSFLERFPPSKIFNTKDILLNFV